MALQELSSVWGRCQQVVIAEQVSDELILGCNEIAKVDASRLTTKQRERSHVAKTAAPAKAELSG